MKLCKTCNETKPSGHFYAHPEMADGLLNRCKDCHKAAMALNRLENPEVRRRERERAKLPHRREASAIIAKRWREQNPEGYRAQTAVNNAIRDKRLAKGPCAVCADTGQVHAHHRDYAKPLDVIWLCPRCHHRLHALFPEIEGRNKTRFEAEEIRA